MMNERIEKLLDEAELDIVSNPDNPDYRWVEGTEEDLLKFAEMIIKECIVVGNRAFHNDNSVVPVFPTKQIKEHFGVE
jgi:hypothetical protein